MVNPRSIKLRLDDGSIVAHGSLLKITGLDTVSRLQAESAASQGLAGEAEVVRLQRLLATAAQELPHIHPTSSLALLEANVPKRPRTAGSGDWTVTAREVLQNTLKSLGQAGAWFKESVPVSLAPDYYNIIKFPMWANLVFSKLDSQDYTSPAAFYTDVKLIWSNCILYNKEGDAVRTAGEQGNRKFEELWLTSGLAGDSRGRRATAGVAAQKFEAEAYEPPPKPKASGKSQQPKASGKKGSAKGGRGGGGHEATSGGAAAAPEMLTQQRREQIGEQLKQDMENGVLTEDQLSELVDMLPPTALKTDADGEQELDFEALDDRSLREIDAWLRRAKNQPVYVSPQPSYNPGPADVASEEEEEYYSESD